MFDEFSISLITWAIRFLVLLAFIGLGFVTWFFFTLLAQLAK